MVKGEIAYDEQCPFRYNVFKSCLLQRRQKASVCRKLLNEVKIMIEKEDIGTDVHVSLLVFRLSYNNSVYKQECC